MRKILFLIIICFILTITDNMPKIFGQQNDWSQSNNAVVGIKKDNIVYIGYKKDNIFYVNIQKYNESEKKYSHVTTLSWQQTVILQSEYKIKAIEDEIFIYSGDKIFIVKMPEVKDDNSVDKNNLVRIEPEIENVIFYNNTCFYVGNDGYLKFYDITKKSFTKYDNVRLEKTKSSIIIIKTEDMTRARERAQAWYNNWITQFEAKIDVDEENIIISEEENILFRRFLGFSQNNQNQNQYDDLKDWYNKYYKDSKRKRDNDISQIGLKFRTDWNIAPNENIFLGTFQQLRSNNISSAVNLDTNVYRGKKTAIFTQLVRIHNETIKTYNELIRINAAQDSRKLLDDNYGIIVSSINKFYQDETSAFTADREKYNNDIKNINDTFRNNTRTNLRSINLRPARLLIGNYIEEFEYIFIQAKDNQPAYTIIIKDVPVLQENRKFGEIGQDMYTFGIHGYHIFQCEVNGLRIYDIFTLSLNNNMLIPNRNNEKIMFSISQINAVLVVNKNLNSRSPKYYIQTIGINNPTSLLNYNNNIIIMSNTNQTRLADQEKPFFSIFIGNVLYINYIKPNNRVNGSSNNNFWFFNMETGAGIILPRS